jgi:tryptophan-rich sensory protein
MMQVMAFSLAGLVSSLKGDEIKKARDLFGNRDYFNNLRQASFTPPAWAFAPAWTLNNVCTIYGLMRVLNKPTSTRGRREYLALQSASWVNYVVFNAAYFSLRSPLNALVVTLSMFVLTILSAWVALFRLKDTFVALSLATLLVWLVIASGAAICQAAWNKDDLYGVGPFFEPLAGLEK